MAVAKKGAGDPSAFWVDPRWDGSYIVKDSGWYEEKSLSMYGLKAIARDIETNPFAPSDDAYHEVSMMSLRTYDELGEEENAFTKRSIVEVSANRFHIVVMHPTEM